MTAKELIFKEISEKIKSKLKRELSREEVMMVDKVSILQAISFNEFVCDEVDELYMLLSRKYN